MSLRMHFYRVIKVRTLDSLKNVLNVFRRKTSFGVPELLAFHLRLLMTYLRMGTNHESIAFYPYLSREQFNNTKGKLEFIQDMVAVFEL